MTSSCFLCFQPVAQNGFSIGCQHAFRVKLNTLHIIFFVLQGHDIVMFIAGRYFKVFREIFIADYPAVIASYVYGRRKAFK